MTAAAPTRLIIDTERGRFHALAAGAADAPLVLVIHGFPDAPPTFAPLLTALADHGYRAVAPWLRGYHPSVADGPFDGDSLAADVHAWRAALSPTRSTYLLGHDWGAVATYLACAQDAAPITAPPVTAAPITAAPITAAPIAAAPIAAAVTLAVPHPAAFLRALARPRQLASSWYMLFFQLPGAPTLARARDLALVDRLWRTWSPGFTLPPALRAEVHACLAASWPAPVTYYRAMAAAMVQAASARALPPALTRPITVPTLYLHGADDGCIRVDSGRGADRHFAGPYRHELVAGAGHFLCAELPTRVADRAHAWFAAHPAGMDRPAPAS